MNRSVWLSVLLTAAWLSASDCLAQRTLQDPHIGYVYPAGGKAGTSFEVTVGGEYLKGITEGFVSGGGVEVSIDQFFRHLSRGEYIGLNQRMNLYARERLKDREKRKGGSSDRVFTREELMAEAKISPYELLQLADYRKREAETKRQLNPQLMEEVTLKITIDPKAAPGERELRVVTQTGMSNPVYFHVGKLTECRETEPNDTKPDTVIRSQLPILINGQIMPGDVDRFTFNASKGMHLVAIGAFRELMPYLADAVPGWFQGVLTLYDAKGKEVAYASSSSGFRQDPVLFYEATYDGDYILEVRDAIYRGREDFVYRVALGELPYITSIFPLGGRASRQLTVEVRGWNLPNDSITFEPIIDRGSAVRPFVLRRPDGTASNRVPFAVDTINEATEQEPNNRPDEALSLSLPMVINGRIDQPGDVDVYKFEAHSRETVVAEVYARRLGSPVDSFLRLTDSRGRSVAFNDDYEDKTLALSTHHADSRMVIKLKTSGVHYLHVTDSQRNGGPDYNYRLLLRYPHPDFDLRVVPSSVIARPGSCVPITVYALRKDGHDDDIFLELDRPPPGYKLGGAWIPGKQEKNRLTLTVPPTATLEPINLEMIGYSATRGRRLIHLAVPAEAMTQAFAYQHLVVAKDWSVMVSARRGGADRNPVRFAREEPLRIVGNTGKFYLLAPGRKADQIRVELSEPPEGITVQGVSTEGEAVAVVIQADPEKIKPGLKGNLLFNALSEQTIEYGKSEEKKPRQVRSPIGMLPALPFEVLGK